MQRLVQMSKAIRINELPSSSVMLKARQTVRRSKRYLYANEIIFGLAPYLLSFSLLKEPLLANALFRLDCAAEAGL